MIATTEFSEVLRRATLQPGDAIVSLVDDLLAHCPSQGVQLDWHAGRCRVRVPGGNTEESIDLPRGKSFFRIILARIAVLCNQRVADSVSPYGGEGEILPSTSSSPVVIKVRFANTTVEQRLELNPETH